MRVPIMKSSVHGCVVKPLSLTVTGIKRTSSEHAVDEVRLHCSVSLISRCKISGVVYQEAAQEPDCMMTRVFCHTDTTRHMLGRALDL
jgi:hypothetical protein